MSYQGTFAGLVTGDGSDVTLARIGLVGCLLLLTLRLFAEQILLVVIPVAGTSACAVYLLTRRHENKQVTRLSYQTAYAGYLPGFVFAGLAAFVALVRLTGGRSLTTHLLAGAIGTALFAQILLLEDRRLRPGFILCQLLLASVVLRFGALFGTPGFIGVDIWSHVPVMIGGIVEEESLRAIDDNKYVMAPIYHLTGAVAALVFDSARAGMFLSVGLLLALASLLVYTTARLLLPARWALFGTALFAFSDQFIRWGIHPIPTSLGLVFFLGALYALTKLYYRADLRLLGLVALFTLAVVFTHQVSTAVMLLLVGVAAMVSLWTLLSRRTGQQTPSTLRPAGLVSVFVGSTTITLLSWANTPFSDGHIFLWRMLEVLEDTVVGDAGFLNLASSGASGGGAGGAEAEQTGVNAQLVASVEWFGFAILLATTVVGCIMLLRRTDSTELKRTYLFSFGGMFFVVYGLSLFGIRTFMPGRWQAFMYAPMAIISAVGLYYLSQNASRRLMLAVVVVIAAGYPVGMAVTEKATLDSPALEDEYPRFAYTESEIGAVETISEIHPPEATEEIRTDHPYRSLYDRVGEYDSPDLVLEDGQPEPGGPVVSRTYQHQGPTAVYEGIGVAAPRQSNQFLTEPLCATGENHLYTNDQVTLCSGEWA